MSKELPYFQFFINEWLNDDISISTYKSKGVFIDICAFYWFKDCIISLAQLKQRYGNAKKETDYLFDNQILKISENNFIKIKFLDDQLGSLSAKRVKRQESGRLGGLAKAKNYPSIAITADKQPSTIIDIDKDKDIDNKIKWPFKDSMDFRMKWSEWENYKKDEFNFKYKSAGSMTAALNMLVKLSSNNWKVAMQIIDQSIANGWKGFFALAGSKETNLADTIEAIPENLPKIKDAFGLQKFWKRLRENGYIRKELPNGQQQWQKK